LASELGRDHFLLRHRHGIQEGLHWGLAEHNAPWWGRASLYSVKILVQMIFCSAIGFLGGAAAWGGAEPALSMAAPDDGGRRDSRGVG